MWGGLLPRVGLRFQEKIKSFIRPSKLLKTFKSNKYYRKSFVYKVLVNFQYCSFSSPLNSEESEVQSRTRVLRLAETLHCSLLLLSSHWWRPHSLHVIVVRRQKSKEWGVRSEECREIAWNRAGQIIGNVTSHLSRDTSTLFFFPLLLRLLVYVVLYSIIRKQTHKCFLV